jgi:dimethylargininase
MPYTHAIVRRPPRSLGQGLTTQNLGMPDIDLALEQHAAYIAVLRQLGLDVTILDVDEHYPDSVFVEDVAILYGGVAIITRPGAPSRSGEVESMREVLRARMPVVELGDSETMELDGGDVLFCGKQVLVGLGLRTNEEGLRCLGQRLREIDPSLSVEGIPFSGVLHLKSGITALRLDMLLYNPACQMEVQFPFARTITLPSEQGYAANVLPINDAILIIKGYPAVATLAHQYYQHVIELDMSEFRKMDGSLTCLSLLW